MNEETPAKSIKIMEFAEETLRSWVKDDGALREACTVMDDWPEDRDLGPSRISSFRNPFLLNQGHYESTYISVPVIQAQAKKFNGQL